MWHVLQIQFELVADSASMNNASYDIKLRITTWHLIKICLFVTIWKAGVPFQLDICIGVLVVIYTYS